MSKRLQVILDDEEWEEIREVAQNQRLSVSEWVRRTLRQARRRLPEGQRGRKLDALRAATRHSFPTETVERMLAEIESGYLGVRPEGGEDDGA